MVIPSPSLGLDYSPHIELGYPAWNWSTPTWDWSTPPKGNKTSHWGTPRKGHGTNGSITGWKWCTPPRCELTNKLKTSGAGVKSSFFLRRLQMKLRLRGTNKSMVFKLDVTDIMCYFYCTLTNCLIILVACYLVDISIY